MEKNCKGALVLIANYHTHTPRCGHASGSEREYIARALEGGFRILGFSDHTPYFFTGTDYRSPIRMDPRELDNYAQTVLGLKNEFQDRLEIHLGVEAEFYPRFFHKTVEELKARGVEYMILGQHNLGNEMDGGYCGRATSDRTFLDRYVGQAMDGIATGLYTYFAHPDLIHFIGEPREYDRQMRKLCTAAREAGLPLEINLLGMQEGRHYPNPDFWRIAAEEGVTAVLGSDAHRPEGVWVPHTEASARAMAEKLHIPIAETVTLNTI